MPCMNCRFSEPPTDAKGNVVLGLAIRLCKRMPPVPIALAGERGELRMSSAWPQVPLMGHCFEFQASTVGEATDINANRPTNGEETAQ